MQVNKTYLYASLAFVILIILFLAYQNSQTKQELAAAQIQAAQNTQAINVNSSNWLSSILNSQAVAALAAGFGSGISGNTKG